MRTTRSVSPTEAGERLIETLRPAFTDIDARLSALGEFRERPAGTVRLTTSAHAAESILWPAIAKILPDYPDVKVELVLDAALTDIVAERFDGGVRLGEQVAKDMIAVRIGPDMRMAAVSAPSYFADHPKPKTPHDLTGHRCINLRLPTRGGLYAWEFEKQGRPLNVRVDGPLIFNDSRLAIAAAIAGAGLAFVLEEQAKPFIKQGQLVRVLSDWCDPFPGFHLYYPSRRQLSPAMALLVRQLRYRGK